MNLEKLPERVANTVIEGVREIAKTPVRQMKNPEDLLHPASYVDVGASMGLKTAEAVAHAGLSAVGAVMTETVNAARNVLGGAAKGTLKLAAAAPVLPFHAAA